MLFQLARAPIAQLPVKGFRFSLADDDPVVIKKEEDVPDEEPNKRDNGSFKRQK